MHIIYSCLPVFSVTLGRVCNSKLILAVCGYRSVPCHHEVSGGRGGDDIFRPCTRVKVREKLGARNSRSVHTNFDSERSSRPYLCMGLRHSSFFFSFSDRVWLAPVPRQCLNAFRYEFLQYRHLFWSAVLWHALLVRSIIKQNLE